MSRKKKQRRVDRPHAAQVAPPPPTHRQRCPNCDEPLTLRVINVKKHTSEQVCRKCRIRLNVEMPPERYPAYAEELKEFGVFV